MLTDGVVTLRDLRPGDREAVVAALQDPEIPRWTTVPSPYGPDDFDAWLERSRERRVAGAAENYLVVDAAGVLVGSIGLHETDTDTPDIGYWIAAEQRGRGHAARAVRLLRDHAIGTRRFAHVDLLIHHDNEASQRVARKAGFVATGERTTCPRDGCADRADYVRFRWPPDG